MPRLLVVDDEKEILEWLYKLFCEQLGETVKVRPAVNVLEALNIIESERIDIAVLDINMPGMSGIELFGKLRERYPHCRVVFLTGYSEFDYVYTAIQHEGVQYILKSEDDATILCAVQKAVALLGDIPMKPEGDVIAGIKQYINEHLAEDLSLARLAELFYFNASYLSRLFKAETGMSLSDYITESRVERAKQLLGEYRLKIYQVSSAVGFDSQHYFTRFFKKSTGMTPYEFRRLVNVHNNM